MSATDPRPLYLRAVTQLEKVAAGVTPDLLDRPTPCTAYDLRTLLGHTAGGIHRIAYVGEGGLWLDVPAAGGEIEDGDWAGAFGRARARWTAAWQDDAKLDLAVEVPWGRVPAPAAIGGYVMEAVTHTWDIARVIAPGTELDEELATIVLGIAHQVLPADDRGPDMPFGPVRPAPEGAGANDRLAAWLGRTL
ncbi:TIGR03086 family metal-binding protein [Kitasatospora paranensis]|uniref:TIGR03086 family metal-binding protein n=1 Tax=Kitasatospora paranensis TaxID=258053 RepID=A0ABW2FS66_9ACTN